MSKYYSIGFSNLDDASGMSGFIEDLLTKNGSVMMRLASDIASTQGAFLDVQTKMGMLALRNIPIQGEPLLPAMDSFRHPPVKIDIRGSSEITTLDLLRPAMNALSIPSKLPTLAELFPSTPTLVTSSLLYIPSILHLTQIPTSLELRNPFSENITWTTLDLELYPCEDQILVFKPIFIPANTDSCFSCCQGSHRADRVALCPRASAGTCLSADVQSFLSPEAIATIVHSLTGGLLMRFNGTVGDSIDDYVTHLFYQQDDLFVTMAE
uniref:Uncharacterized protein n=1 Tax=Hyaloperonospora arabidopsidis (strain Emoy2) TaxID=559515 RepID=M4B5P6_HYAAE